MKSHFVLVAVAGVAFIGCEKKDDKAAAEKLNALASQAAAAMSQPASEAPSAAAPAPASAEAAVSAAASGAAQALGDAMGAAAAAAGNGPPCEQAYNAIEAMVKAMEAKMGPGKGKLPAKDKFIAACSELPPAVQNCMSMNYAMAHQQECQEAQAKIDPATKEKLKALMSGN